MEYDYKPNLTNLKVKRLHSDTIENITDSEFFSDPSHDYDVK